MRREESGLLKLLLPLLIACKATEEAAPSPSAPAEKPTLPALELRVAYGSEKKTWMEAEVAAFEATNPTLASGRPIDVVTTAGGSGEIVGDILSGSSQPHVFSPASSAYVTLLNESWLQQPGHTNPLSPAGEPIVLSPVVIAMWEPMARALGWPDKRLGWKDLLSVSSSGQGWSAHGHPEWGAFKLAHTHPGLSNSGLLAVLAEVYAGAGKTRGLTLEDLSRKETTDLVSAVEASLVHYGKSTSFLADKMAERGPSYVSAAVLYENQVIELRARALDMPLTAIYPVEGTFWSDHPYAVLDAPQVGPEEREAAASLLSFLKARPAQEAALAAGFRPADPTIPIGAPIVSANGVDPREPQTLLDLPEGPVLSAVLKLWWEHKKPSEVTLVFDKSGSMRGDPLARAKEGASAFLADLGERDAVSLLFFDDQVGAPSAPVPLAGGGRQALDATVQSAIASGGTALYDAVMSAHAAATERARQAPGTIHAIVVMTDGRDEHSKQTLDAVKRQLGTDSESAVKVFTIAYGEGADPTVLTAISDAGRGGFSRGGQGDIRSVFRDMAAFF